MVNVYECNCRQLFGQYCYCNVSQANMMYNLYLYRLTTCYLQIFCKSCSLGNNIIQLDAFWNVMGRPARLQYAQCLLLTMSRII